MHRIDTTFQMNKSRTVPLSFYMNSNLCTLCKFCVVDGNCYIYFILEYTVSRSMFQMLKKKIILHIALLIFN